MKRKYLIITFLASLFMFIINVKADYKATVLNPSGAKCSLASNSTGYCFYANTSLNTINAMKWLDTGDGVTVITNKEKVKSTNDTCASNYIYVGYVYPKNNNTYYGYYCEDYLSTGALTDELKTYFRGLGFPESYWDSLALLRTAHPNWTFVPVNTNLDWNSVISRESVVGMSLIETTYDGYKSTLGGSYDYYTDTFTVLEGSRWYAANSQVVAYYMDPRNFLSDMYIFEFETLQSKPEIQTLEGVSLVLGNNQYLKDYASSFIDAASGSGVSSVYLSALAMQEVGGGSLAINGEGFTYSEDNNKYYSLRGTWIDGGYYNVYNIGAGTDASPAQNSVVYARGGVNGTETSYDRPWDTIPKAIIGGAKFIGESYINKGQYTIYFKKFNVASTYWDTYSHQYQTNVKAASSEGTKVYRSYYNLGIVDSNFVFSIPIYNNMPDKTSLPNTGNPNNYLKSLSINDENVNGFDGAETNYKVYVENSTSSVELKAETVSSYAQVSNLGKKSLNVGNNSFDITVTAENGDKKTYKLNVVRSENEYGEPTVSDIVENSGVKSDGTYFSGIELGTNVNTLVNKIKSLNANASITIKDLNNNEKDSQTFATGDVISITSAGETKEYTVVIYGDTNGDGKITVLDLLVIQKHILGVSNLNGAKGIAADPSKDGKINALDLLKVQKHILEVSEIEQ